MKSITKSIALILVVTMAFTGCSLKSGANTKETNSDNKEGTTGEEEKATTEEAVVSTEPVELTLDGDLM